MRLPRKDMAQKAWRHLPKSGSRAPCSQRGCPGSRRAGSRRAGRTDRSQGGQGMVALAGPDDGP